ncbi:ankyrin repeat-containing protein [Aequorivita sublithincola DSM 14238]|uniref:Ankyrin repeat-containing protein n=1 Tax=Aequorivita sublithincola (strain DSM 14238 / LMG 21431 / ACAM 643 / 9-3) TaxID=746697 RepID=I3Z008_AEQSU|nr:ankyrin repeat domain-containing protein [Aequorivita sublithincola]AFL82576.1 ankyrin repeat-containing protein [Aequorivita sublithincola DSM 14238]
MKTQKNHSTMTSIIHFSFLFAMLIISSCKENTMSAQGNPLEKSTAKAPNVDLQTAVLTDNIQAIKEHISAGSNLNEKEQFGGSTPLITASVFGKTQIAELLINAGADINIQNNDGSTALITAAFFCRPEIVKMLLKKNANKTLKNNYGQTAYESVAGSFDSVKGAYEGLGAMLEPMGLKLDHAYLKKTRPEIAKMLK